MSKTAKDILIDARATLADVSHWARNGFARAASGIKLGSSEVCSPNACAWCLDGALMKAAVCDLSKRPYDAADLLYDNIDNRGDRLKDAYGILATVLPGSGYTDNRERVWRFNDASAHTDVIYALDAAIARA